MRKSYRHVPCFKYFVLLAILAVVIIACFLFGSIHSKAGSNGNPDTGRVKLYTSVYIQEGDTLWSIAEEYVSEEYDTIDDYIDELQQMNHIGDVIHAGCYLTVSYYAEPGH